jgi:hypothetical protein
MHLAPAALLAALPLVAVAEFHCEQSVSTQSTWCASSQITSIPQQAGTAICADFVKRLAAACRADWDRPKSCEEFAGRFERLLVQACEGQRLSRKSCTDWGQAFAVGPLGRCKRGKTTY